MALEGAVDAPEGRQHLDIEKAGSGQGGDRAGTPWPLLSTKRSRSGHCGSSARYRISWKRGRQSRPPRTAILPDVRSRRRGSSAGIPAGSSGRVRPTWTEARPQRQLPKAFPVLSSRTSPGAGLSPARWAWHGPFRGVRRGTKRFLSSIRPLPVYRQGDGPQARLASSLTGVFVSGRINVDLEDQGTG